MFLHRLGQNRSRGSVELAKRRVNQGKCTVTQHEALPRILPKVAAASTNGGLGDILAAYFAASGYDRIEPPVLQPAAVFLDLSGEDMASRMFVTQDDRGAEFCLRPEYTIPVVRAYLASPQAGEAAAFSCLGPVFRLRPPGQDGEFLQAGIESFGRADSEAADAEILALALAGVRAAAGDAPLAITIGDVALFKRLLDQLRLSPVWQRRLRRGFAHGLALSEILKPMVPAGADHSGVLAALEGTGKEGARALVSDLLSIAGISSVGGRTTAEIAERFLAKASERAAAGPGAEQEAALRRFLAIKGDPDSASLELRALAQDTGLDMAAALDSFDARTGFIAACGLDVAALRFDAAFGRELDYYTGFVFEAHDPRRADGRPVAGGGRYDRLARTLGAPRDIPAVGAAVWVDRLTATEA